MEELITITHEIVFGSRKSKIRLIKSLCVEEYENIEDVFLLAEMSKKQLNILLYSVFDYYSQKIQLDLKKINIYDSFYESYPAEIKKSIDQKFENL